MGRVFGVALPPHVGSDGTIAGFMTVNAHYGVAHVPDGVDLAVAGALGLAGSAAVTALKALRLKAGQTLLISGATGGGGDRRAVRRRFRDACAGDGAPR